MNARQMLAGLPMSGYADGGAVTDAQIRTWLAANPGASDAQISQAMNTYGVSPARLAAATGYDAQEVTRRYDAVNPAWTPGDSVGRQRALERGDEAGWLAQVKTAADKYMANATPGTAAEAYDTMIRSGIGIKDLLDSGVSQTTIDKALSIETAPEQMAVNTLTQKALTSTLSQNPNVTPEVAARGTEAIYTQARQFVENLQKDGVTPQERQYMQQVASQQGWGYADIRAAGIDPSLLFNQPAQVVRNPFPDPKPYTPVTVYDPEKFARENAGADLYKKGEVALDTAFRESAPRTAIPGMPGAYEYTPAAKLRPATGAGMSWTPPVVTSRPRSLLSPTLLSYVSPSQQFAQARATQDQALLGAFRESGLPQNASNFNTWRNRLRSGEFGTGAAFDPTAFQSAFGSWASTQAPGTTAQGPAPGGLGSVGTGVTGYSEIAGGLQPIDLRRLPAATFAHGGEVSSARRMLEQVKKPEGFAEGGMPTTGPEQTESRSMLERLGRFISLDTPQDMSLGETAADIGMGFLPGVGTAQGARDFERARREGDMLGMGLSAASMIPVAGGAVRAARSVGKASKAVDVLPAAERQVNLERFMEGSNAPPVLYTGTSKDVDFDKMNVPRNGAWLTASPESASRYAVENDSKGLKYVPETRSFIEVNTSSRVMPVHLSAKNPYVITDIDAFNKELYALAGDNYRRGQGLIFDKLRSQKYDSVHFVDPEGKEDVWVALESPTQMKSAVGNRGTFDPTSPVLTKKDGGEVAVPETESRSMLDRLASAASNVNRAFYENVSGPAVGSLVDMTVGLGDLAQRGTRYLGERMGYDAGEYTPVAPRVRQALGVDNYNPYTVGGVAANILPFARGEQAISAAASGLPRVFPNLGRETGAYVGSELAAAGAQEVAPDSTAAQMLAAVAGGMGGSSLGGFPNNAPAVRISEGEVPSDSARAMLNELTPETGAVPEEGALTAAVTRPVEPMPVSESEEMLTQLDEIQAAPATPEARLTTQESRAINASVGRNPTKRQEAAEKARQFKQDYSTDMGWTPVEITGIKYNKAKRPEILTKKISYNFEKPPAGLDQGQWATQLSDRLSSEVSNVVDRAQNGDAAALGILRQANWYRSMRDRLRSEFGGIGDVFADVLGTTSAQTGVEQNFKNATEILRRFSRGEFDNELTAYQRRLGQGLSVDGQELTALYKAGEFPLITNAAGSLFNSNSPASMGALLDMFRSVKQGSSPKTPNFTGNLIGLTNEATIDVWAARILRRLSGQDRIPPLAEKGVTGKHRAGSTLTQPVVGQEFGFGQDVFRRAADTINQSGTIKNVVPEMGNLGPDDLQAVAWFMEKERWTENGWTSKAGEGGSLDFEMSLAGAPSQERVYELRRTINAGFKPPPKRKTETDLQYDGRVEVARRQYDEAKARNQAELTIMEAPLQRYQLGVSGERPARTMSNYAQAELAAPLDDAVRDDPTVLTYNLANTYGSFMGQTERALNAEFVTRANFDPQALVRRLVEQGKDYDQDAVFFSKVVPSTTPNARPGVEIYFKESVTPEQMARATERLRQYGVDGFTYVTDMRFDDRIDRQTRTGSPETAALTGLRFQYIPEFDDSFDPARAAEIYEQKASLFQDIVSDTMAEGNVSDARLNFYDTQVFFRDNYDEFLGKTASDRNLETRGELPRGANAP